MVKGKELEDRLLEVDESLKHSNGYYFSKSKVEETAQPSILQNAADFAKHSPSRFWGIKTPSTVDGSSFKENII